jgi:hypothetical protein
MRGDGTFRWVFKFRVVLVVNLFLNGDDGSVGKIFIFEDCEV